MKGVYLWKMESNCDTEGAGEHKSFNAAQSFPHTGMQHTLNMFIQPSFWKLFVSTSASSIKMSGPTMIQTSKQTPAHSSNGPTWVLRGEHSAGHSF